MSMVSDVFREQKREWLMRPLNWAMTVSFSAGVFGIIYGLTDFPAPKLLIFGLSGILLAVYSLLLWEFSRINRATKQ